MSISVKSISVSIDGTQSNKYIINLSGGTFVMSNFCMTEQLLSHCYLSFKLVKDPYESVTDAQMQVCADIIGKEVELFLQTDPMENELPGYSGDSVADISFKGFIASAQAKRTTSSQYVIHVQAVSYDGVLDDHPDYRTFEKMMVKDIIEDQLQAAPKVEFAVDPALDLEGKPLLYSAKWKETTWGFIRRMAIRYGEWLFHDGRKLYFGKMPEKDAVRLSYPSREMTDYDITLETGHMNYSHARSLYLLDSYMYQGYQDEMGGMLNPHNEAAFNASKELYPYPTLRQYTEEALDISDWNVDINKNHDIGEAKGTKAGLLTYSGSTSCSKLSVGVKLTVVDNYITDAVSNQKSDVPQEEILITQVTHMFSCDDSYSNTFSGLAGNTEYPPYANSAAIPFAMPTRAWVDANDDHDHTVCVRVIFPWAMAQEEVGREKVRSPWIRVEQPYTSHWAGAYVIPEVGTEVMVDFEGGNAEMPYVRASNFNCITWEDQEWVTEDRMKNNEVKAFRTKNGHTIEIHDLDKNGYIRIYDYKKENYILTFSTDEKLIKLESTGNIELYAQNDIIMEAGHDIRLKAGHDKTEGIGHDHTVEVEHDYERSVGNDTRGNSGRNTKLWSGNDTGIVADHDINESADHDMYLHAGNDRTVSVERNDAVYVSQNQHIEVSDSQDVKVTNKQQTHAMDIRVEADNKLEVQSTEHVQKANAKMNINAQAAIDIKAAIVKVN